MPVNIKAACLPLHLPLVFSSSPIFTIFSSTKYKYLAEMALHDQSRGITQLRKLAFSGNIEGLRATLSDWREGHGIDELFIQNTAILLSEAVDHNFFEVAECLLDFHVPMNTNLFLKATRNTLYRILTAFLHHGWDINAPVDPFTPSALALVSPSFFMYLLTCLV